uniref:Uncharacterized protein n=1 Tax=Brassica oleracea var. oleracea TaxID=109376 RepID=A0A0D3DK08_BRAOL
MASNDQAFEYAEVQATYVENVMNNVSPRPSTGLQRPLTPPLGSILTPDNPWLMGLPRPLTQPVGSIPYYRWCVNFLEAQNSWLLTLHSPHEFSPFFGLTSTISRISCWYVIHPSTTPAQARLTLEF